MHKIAHLHHTADVRLKIEADTLEELFRGAALAMNAILKPGFCRENGVEIRRQITLHAIDTTALLVDFLSDLLTLSCSEYAIFCEMEFRELTEHSLNAEAGGRRVPLFDEDIKAVTYHEAAVRRNKQGNYETLLVFDI